MDAKQLFLQQHAMVHSAEIAPEGEWSLVDAVLSGLTDEQLRSRPAKGTNSIIWIVWHMARTEDVAMNLLVAGRSQILDDAWLQRLKLSRLDIGTAMTDEEVTDFSKLVDIEVLSAYRNAVGLRTRQIVESLNLEELEEVVDATRVEELLAQGILAEGARRVAKFWGGKRKSFFLTMPATGHNFMHLSEALTIRRQMGL